MDSTAKSTLSLVCALALLLPCRIAWSETHADSFRCSSNLVSVGATKADVQRSCGAPAARQASCERSVTDGLGQQTQACIDTERWTYQPGYGQFTTILHFEDGTLVDITYGDRQ